MSQSVFNVQDFGAVGDGVTDDYPAFLAALAALEGLATDARGAKVYIPFGTYRLSQTLRMRRSCVIQGDSGSGPFGGSRLLVNAGVDGVAFEGPNTSGGNGRADWSVMRDLSIFAAGKTATAHGISVRAHGLKVENVGVRGFGGDGIHIDSNAGPNVIVNCNNFELAFCRIDLCVGHGVYVRGNDSNQGVIRGVDCSENGGDGFHDNSFLGNQYFGCHAAGNKGRSYSMGEPGANVHTSNLYGCYAEGGQKSVFLNQYSIVYGGVYPDGFDATSQGLAFIGTNPGGSFQGHAEFRNKHVGSNEVVTHFGQSGGSGLEIGCPASWGTGRGSFSIDVAKWLNFIWNNSASYRSFGMAGYGAAYPDGSTAPVGMFAFPPQGYVQSNRDNGFSVPRTLIGNTAPATGGWKLGDFVRNGKPTVASDGSLIFGWVCTVGGAPGTWKEVMA